MTFFQPLFSNPLCYWSTFTLLGPGCRISWRIFNSDKIPKEMRGKYWGCRVRRRQQPRKRKYKPNLPSIIMGKIRWSENKMEKLVGLFQDCFGRLLWCALQQHGSIKTYDSCVGLNSFQLVQTVGNYITSAKKQSRGSFALRKQPMVQPSRLKNKCTVMKDLGHAICQFERHFIITLYLEFSIC